MSEILNRIDFAGRACFQFYDAFFRHYHFDTYGPITNFFYFFLWNYGTNTVCNHTSDRQNRTTARRESDLLIESMITDREGVLLPTNYNH